MCVTKSVKPSFLDRDDGIRQQPPSQLKKNKKKQIVYSILSCFLKIKKKSFGLRTWKGQLKPRVLLGLPLLSRIRREKSERGRLSSPMGAKREPYHNYVESFDKAAIRHHTILHCEETLADSKYSEFSLGCGYAIFRECGDSEEALWYVSLLLEIGL